MGTISQGYDFVNTEAHGRSVATVAEGGNGKGDGGSGYGKASAANTPPDPFDEFLTAGELAAMLKIAVKTIHGYVANDRIPYVKIQRNTRFVKGQILKWLRKRNHIPRNML